MLKHFLVLLEAADKIGTITSASMSQSGFIAIDVVTNGETRFGLTYHCIPDMDKEAAHGDT